MAVEFMLEGEFELSADLERLLLEMLPRGHSETSKFDEVLFRLVSPLVQVTAVYPESTLSGTHRFGRMKTKSALLFRVLDKNRVMKAEELIVRCVNRLLEEREGDVMLFFNFNLPLLARSRGTVKLFLYEENRDDDFWSVPRCKLIESPHQFVRRKHSRANIPRRTRHPSAPVRRPRS